jgi:hypothetical protein
MSSTAFKCDMSNFRHVNFILITRLISFIYRLVQDLGPIYVQVRIKGILFVYV